MRLPDDPDIQKNSVNILPMIDVIFAILAFFVLSTLYLTRAEGLPVSLPEAVTATPQNQIDVTLTIAANGDLFLGDRPTSLPDLATEITDLTTSNQPILVTIRADAATPHGRVVAAMDQLRKVEGVRLGIATTQP